MFKKLKALWLDIWCGKCPIVCKHHEKSHCHNELHHCGDHKDEPVVEKKPTKKSPSKRKK